MTSQNVDETDCKTSFSYLNVVITWEFSSLVFLVNAGGDFFSLGLKSETGKTFAETIISELRISKRFDFVELLQTR